MNNVENLLQQILDKMSEMAVVQATIAKSLEDIYSHYSISDVCSEVHSVLRAVEDIADNLKDSG